MSGAAPELLSESAELVDYNLFSTHSVLAEALSREGAAAEHGALPRSCDFAALSARILRE